LTVCIELTKTLTIQNVCQAQMQKVMGEKGGYEETFKAQEGQIRRLEELSTGFF
jgi:hypothetical protein